MNNSEDTGRDQTPNEELDREVEGMLDVWSKDLQRQVAEASETVTPRDQQVSLDTFAKLSRGKGKAGYFRIVAAAAALLILTLGYAAWTQEDPSGPVLLLGSGDIESMSPSGAVDGYDRFSWKVKGDARPRFGLRVWNAGTLDAVLKVDGLERPEFRPTAEQRSRLGSSISWQVVLQSEEGRALSTSSATASLRSP